MKMLGISTGVKETFDRPYDQRIFLRHAIRLSGKKDPNVLIMFLVSNSHTKELESYERLYEQYHSLGAHVDHLYFGEAKDYNTAKSKIESADILYEVGGNTLRAVGRVKRYNLKPLLDRARDNNKVLCGASAGSIIWCDSGVSDSRVYKADPDRYTCVRALGYLPVICCPHYHQELARTPELKRIMLGKKIPAIAIDYGAALKIDGEVYEVVRALSDSNIYKTYWNNGEYIEKVIANKGLVSELIRMC